MELFTSRETKRIATFKVLFTIIRTSFYIYIFVHTFLHLNCISDFGCLLLHNVSLKFIPCRDRWRMNIREELFSCSNNSFAYLKLVLFGLFFFCPLPLYANSLMQRSSLKSCPLDPMPSTLVSRCDVLLPVLTRLITMSLKSGQFPVAW